MVNNVNNDFHKVLQRIKLQMSGNPTSRNSPSLKKQRWGGGIPNFFWVWGMSQVGEQRAQEASTSGEEASASGDVEWELFCLEHGLDEVGGDPSVLQGWSYVQQQPPVYSVAAEFDAMWHEMSDALSGIVGKCLLEALCTHGYPVTCSRDGPFWTFLGVTRWEHFPWTFQRDARARASRLCARAWKLCSALSHNGVTELQAPDILHHDSGCTEGITQDELLRMSQYNSLQVFEIRSRVNTWCTAGAWVPSWLLGMVVEGGMESSPQRERSRPDNFLQAFRERQHDDVAVDAEAPPAHAAPAVLNLADRMVGISKTTKERATIYTSQKASHAR